ncbi:DUF4129 domain-containing protein [Salinibacterium sp. G-O1]|uniref:DUF4129 domain-containing protein n=1 Tax=Salinibacterium sp. G-O1 TaxID=3046208 RepID=UPI0024B8C3BE|nr:DUF4129 domain-containing protein [Salinibacterium sp. G-O1]MDJ0335881.1 DUF4129 domain-containing protein [Salinibacterium sp. G-O1]
MSPLLALSTLPFDVPVDPDAPEAADLLITELSKPAYQAAKPTWFDLLAKAVQDWLSTLRLGDVQGPPVLGIGVIVAIVVVGIVVAFLIFGLPRFNRRSTVTGSLFGDDDHRTAAQIRDDAEAAAARGDHSTAVAEMFRSIARGLAERSIITTSPGTTARDFAIASSTPFPELGEALRTAATSFDDVRYLGREGTAAQFQQVATLEKNLRAARPVLELV